VCFFLCVEAARTMDVRLSSWARDGEAVGGMHEIIVARTSERGVIVVSVV